MTEKTKHKLMSDIFDEYDREITQMRNERDKKLKEIKDKFRDKVCEVCGK